MKMKNKQLISISVGFILVFFYLLVSASCTSGVDRMEVRIEIENPQAIDFENYKLIFYKDLLLEWPAKDYSPEEELESFFLGELPKIIEKDIEPLDSNIKTDIVLPPDSLLITGILKLEIKERSKIKEIKDETGKPKNIFVSIQHWNMTMELVMKDSKGEVIFKQDFVEKLPEVDTYDTTTKFNFEKIFFRITNKLVQKIQKTKRIHRRYLLH